MGKLRNSRVLIIGAGNAAESTARALSEVGAEDIIIANRTYAHALSLANKLGGQAISLDDLQTTVGQVDIIVSATSSPGYIVTPDLVSHNRYPLAPRSLLVIDVALPRDVDPAVKAIPFVSYYDLDSVGAIGASGCQERKGVVQAVEAMVLEQTNVFMEWLKSQAVVPTVVALRDKAEAIRQLEQAKLAKHLPDLSQAELEALAAYGNSIINKILHGPIRFLRQSPNSEDIQVVRALFGLR